MKLIPDNLSLLVEEFARLPGVGEKTAFRFVLSLTKKALSMERMALLLAQVRRDLRFCEVCGFWKEDQCSLCEDPNRQNRTLCIVRESPDVLALEKSKKHSWRYHILGSLLSPLNHVSPKDLNLESLYERLDQFDEIIFALDPTLEGEATVLFIKEKIKQMDSKIHMSRLALGIPLGSSVEYLDGNTLEHALSHRIGLE